MTDAKTLLDAAARAGASRSSLYEDVTASTQATARRLAVEGAEEWTVVVAGHQTSGRGRLGRVWTSEPGSSLLFSVVLRPLLDARRAGLVMLLAGVAMAEAARVCAGAQLRCKWPNDLLSGESKVGGILSESRVVAGELEHVVLGVGVNVTAAPEGIPGAGFLSEDADAAALLHSFLMCMKQRWRTHDPRFGPEVIEAWRAVSATLGRRVAAETLDGSRIEGIAVDLDAEGSLLVETAGGLRPVAFGEIEHLG